MPRKPRLKKATFHWDVKPSTMLMEGTFYMDGSCFEGNIPELSRCGWGFVCVDEQGKVIGSAYGTCPDWINDIGGAEAWAMLQAALCAMPGRAKYWTDCQPLLTMISKGQQIAEDPKNIYARVHSLLMPLLDDTPLDSIGWMPSHTTAKQVGKVRRGDGELLTKIDSKSK